MEEKPEGPSFNLDKAKMHFDHENSFQLFNRDKTPKRDESPFLAVKDQDSYLIGGRIFLEGSDSEDEDLEEETDSGDDYYSKYNTNQEGVAYKLFEGSDELYSHKFIKHVGFEIKAVYVKALHSYFLLLWNGLYRKDIDNKPHYPYYTRLKRYAPTGVRANPKLPGRILVVNYDEINVINLFNKVIELTIKIERNSRLVNFWGKNGDSLAILQDYNYLSLMSLLRRKDTHLEQIECEEDDNNSARFLCASPDQKFVFVSHYHDYDNPNEAFFSLQVFEVSDTSFKLRASCRGGHRFFGAWVHEIRFLKRFRENYLFLVFREVLEGFDVVSKSTAVELFVFNAIKNTLRPVKGAKLQLEKAPFAVEVLDTEEDVCRFIVVDRTLHAYNIKVFSEE